jgi:hypothetical protein
VGIQIRATSATGARHALVVYVDSMDEVGWCRRDGRNSGTKSGYENGTSTMTRRGRAGGHAERSKRCCWGCWTTNLVGETSSSSTLARRCLLYLASSLASGIALARAALSAGGVAMQQLVDLTQQLALAALAALNLTAARHPPCSR